MTTGIAGRGRARGSVLHPRTCAAVTAASCLAHLGLVAVNQHGMWLNVLMLAKVAVCLPCAVHIWRRPRARALRQVMASALAMTGVHAVLLLGVGAGGHSHHGAAVAGTAGAAAAPDAGALLAVIALELTTALAAATLLARLRGPLAGTVSGRVSR